MASLQGNSVSVSAAKTTQDFDLQTVQTRAYAHNAQTDESLVGGNVTAGDSLTVIANGAANKGQGSIQVTGASLTSGTLANAPGALTLQAN
ncbi:MAG TPA: hypothetical protein VH328_13455, partial [Burkholderiaceae bacterium]|nr:hypothetical protein [Burkholderiaceae bacterium]